MIEVISWLPAVRWIQGDGRGRLWPGEPDALGSGSPR